MLYDPKWEQEAKADPISLESLIAWLEKQPADGEYNFRCNDGGCLIAVYGASIGLGEEGWRDFHTKLFQRNQLRIASGQPYTFGAALKRARAIASR